jgi:hypothetical protein
MPDMTPLELALSVYLRHPTRRTFADDLAAHLRNGYVFATPTAIVMGRPVPRAADPIQIVTPEVSFDADACDCWHIWMAAGDWRSVLAAYGFPFPLPWVSWERAFRLRFYRAEKLLAIAGLVSPTLPWQKVDPAPRSPNKRNPGVRRTHSTCAH